MLYRWFPGFKPAVEMRSPADTEPVRLVVECIELLAARWLADGEAYRDNERKRLPNLWKYMMIKTDCFCDKECDTILIWWGRIKFYSGLSVSSPMSSSSEDSELKSSVSIVVVSVGGAEIWQWSRAAVISGVLINNSKTSKSQSLNLGVGQTMPRSRRWGRKKGHRKKWSNVSSYIRQNRQVGLIVSSCSARW